MVKTVNPTDINKALKLIEQHELIGAKIITHPSRFNDIKQLCRDEDIDGSIQDILSKYMRGYIGQDIK